MSVKPIIFKSAKNRIPWEWSWIFCGFFWKFRICWVALGSTPVVYFIFGGGLKSLGLVLPSNWWWGKIFGVLHLPSPASYISSVLLSSDWNEKKYNLLKRIYCRNGIEGRSVLDREIVKNPGQKVAEIHDIIELNETLGRFWKTKRDHFEGVLRFRKEA